MATKEWDFECPQFVDFAAGLDNSSKDDIFFDCKDHQSPADEIVYKILPEANTDENILTEEAENRLLDKMETALSMIENTPKIKKNIVKGKLLTDKFLKDLCSQELKAVSKPKTAHKPPASLHRSKSIAHLNKIITEKANNTKHGLRRRSSSLNDLGMHKKQTYPMTPMCLKRTIIKAKGKVVKTSEEMELEEIAKLQKQLIQHLRHNEITLKRLKLKPRQCVIPKSTQAKPENLKGNKDLNVHQEKHNVPEKEARRNILTLNSAAMKNEAIKIDNIINSEPIPNKNTDKELARKSKYPTVSSVFSEVNEKNKTHVTKKPHLLGQKLGFHSGVLFHASAKKNTFVKPFSFDCRIKERNPNTGAEQKAEISISHFKVDEGKENIPYIQSQSTVKKTKGLQNIKYDINKLSGTNKKMIEKRAANPLRGLPLSENFARD